MDEPPVDAVEPSVEGVEPSVEGGALESFPATEPSSVSGSFAPETSPELAPADPPGAEGIPQDVIEPAVVAVASSEQTPEPLHPQPSAPLRQSPKLRSAADIGPRAPSGTRGPRRRGRRSLAARLAAVLALLAVIAALVLLIQSLGSSKHTATVAPPPVGKVLVAEGKTRAQIAQIAAKAGLTGSYLLASRRSPLLDPSRYGASAHTPDLEGFLFPATYELNLRAPAKRLVEEQLTAFRENFGDRELARARALHVTAYQLLTVASMIEREALVPADRAKIAAVIYNRLAAGMPLGIDATIYYAVEREKKIATYTHELTEAQLHINSPYNTRIHTGLPPTPISNPGNASIAAAAHPAHISYLYYVAAADGCGEQAFSDTLAQFEANDAAYQAAVAKNGGRPPVCKRK